MTQKLQLIANFLWYHICLSQTSHCNRKMWLVSKWLSMSLKMLMHALQAAATQMPCKMDTLVLRSLCTRTALCALRYCYCWSPALENFHLLCHTISQNQNSTSGWWQTSMPDTPSSNFVHNGLQCQFFVNDFESNLGDLNWWILNRLLSCTLIHCAVPVWLAERGHRLEMWPYNAPGLRTRNAHPCSVSPQL
jgi:hypothetical protein